MSLFSSILLVSTIRMSSLECRRDVKTQTTAQKIKFTMKGFFSKFDQIHRKLLIWWHLLKNYFIKNFIFCAVNCALHIKWEGCLIFSHTTGLFLYSLKTSEYLRFWTPLMLRGGIKKISEMKYVKLKYYI